MQMSIILSEGILKKFCKELNINTKTQKNIIKVHGNKAEYYDFEGDCFCELDINIAKKYI